MLDYRVILAGAIPAALIALAADFGMSTLEKKFHERKTKLIRHILVILCAAAAVSAETDRIVWFREFH